MSDWRRPRFLRADTRREGYSPSPTRFRTSSRTKPGAENGQSEVEKNASGLNCATALSADGTGSHALQDLLDMTAHTSFRGHRSRRFSSPICDQRTRGSKITALHSYTDLVVPLMVTSTKATMPYVEEELRWTDTTPSISGVSRCPFWKASLSRARQSSVSVKKSALERVMSALELPAVRTTAQEVAYTAWDIHDSEVLDMIDAIRPPLPRGPCPSYQSEGSINLSTATSYQLPELQTLSSLKVAARIYQIAYQLHLEEFQNAAIDVAHRILKEYSIPPALLTLPQWEDHYHTKFWKMMY